MNRVTMKQMHQKDMDQLPTTPLQMPMSATSEKATQVQKSCGRRRSQNTQKMKSPPGYILWVDMVFWWSGRSQSPVQQWSSLRTRQRKIQFRRQIKSDAWKRLRAL